MVDWKSFLKADPTDWLLEDNDPSIRYWTLKDLLKRSESNPEILEAKRRIPQSAEVKKIFSQVHINNGPFWSKPNGDIYWGTFSTGSVLLFLAETGLTKEDPRIEDLAKFLSSYQSDEGFFKLTPKGPGWWSCFTATVLGSLMRFGYTDDERVDKGVNWLFQNQRLDGGWYCAKNALKGESKEKLASCPHAVLNILWAFMNNPKIKNRRELVQAVEFLLCHWETKKPIPDVDPGRYGIGSRFQWIRYPLFEYHLLKYVYVLAHYDYALKDKRLREAADLLISKQDNQGRWAIDKPYQGWDEFEFGKKCNPSKWATLNALRVLTRL